MYQFEGALCYNETYVSQKDQNVFFRSHQLRTAREQLCWL